MRQIMREHLYFIADICNSLRNGFSTEELADIVEDIVSKGKEQKYKRGYGQFLQFVEAGRAGWLAMSVEQKQMISQIVNELMQESSKEISPTNQSLSLLLERNNVTLAILEFLDGNQTFLIGDLLPGEYSLRTDSDWLLWQESLSEVDLYWTSAYPDQDLPMAADTEDVEKEKGKEYVLLNGEVVLRVYPGLENGTMEIMVNGHVAK